MVEKLVITPWEIKGSVLGVDYEKLMKQFGADALTPELIERLKRYAKGDLHILLRRKFFVSHRDLNYILNEYERGNPFFLYTGRGPSGPVHLGHILPWMLCKWLQDKFDVDLWFQITDDEKFLFKEGLSLEKAHEWALENALDVIALGFDPHKTHIIIDTDNGKTMYKQAIRVAKHLNFSTVKAAFGFSGENNVGEIFYTSMQAVPCFLPSVLAGKNIPCLIPLGIDQDPHFRVARDIIPKLGYPKPALVHCKFLSGLGQDGKMSASQPHTAIYTTDTPEEVAEKIKKHAFSGGQPTAEEQRKKGANPDIDVSYQWLQTFFEPDDDKVVQIYNDYKSGKMMTSELKQYLIDKINAFLAHHQKEREKARSKLDKFLWKD